MNCKLKTGLTSLYLKFLILILISFSACLSQPQDSVVFEKRPNVLFIISDDLTANALGVYDNNQCHTPNIDRLAGNGIKFLRAYSQYPVCGPSRAALMTGMYPERLGIMTNDQSKNLDQNIGDHPTLPEYFRQNGYHTTRMGKIYHMRVPGDITAGVDGPDHPDSWDTKYNFQGAEWMTDGIHDHISNEDLQFKPGAHYNLGFGTAFYVVQSKGDGSDQPDHKAASKAIEILSEHQEGVDKPFFLSVGFIRPHVPLVAPSSEFFQYLPAHIALPEKKLNDQDDIPRMGITATSKFFGIQSNRKQQKVLSAYYASVSFMDKQVGRLIEALEINGLLENTIVVFTSDHGYHLGEHDLWQKLSLHEESIRIPLIICGPGIVPSITTAITEQIDIYPTLASLAGLKIPDHVQGQSLLPVIGDSERSIRQAAFSVTRKGSMIRTEDWAYMRYNDNSEELYNMVNDPFQFDNLSDESEFQNQKIELIRMLQNHKLEIFSNIE